MRRRTLTAFLAAASLLGLAGLTAIPADAAQAASQPRAPLTNGTFVSGHVTDQHKATTADIRAGVSPNATVYGCTGSSPLDNPNTGGVDNKLGLSLAWQESTTTSGRPEARVNEGHNAAVFINNHAPTDSVGHPFFRWIFAGWRDLYDPIHYYGDAGYGGSGYTASPGSYGISIYNGNVYNADWVNSPEGAGFSQFIEYWPKTPTSPDFVITLRDLPSGHTISSHVVVLADGNCGQLLLW